VCPHHPHLLYLLHRAGWSGDAVAATSFTTAALIGTALALEVQAIASPAARLRKKSVLRINVSPEVPVGNERRFLQFHVFSEVASNPVGAWRTHPAAPHPFSEPGR
jgi:hypothetical protein